MGHQGFTIPSPFPKTISFLQARKPEWIRRPFFATFDPEARWLTDLKPAFGHDRFFYEEELDEILTGDVSAAG